MVPPAAPSFARAALNIEMSRDFFALPSAGDALHVTVFAPSGRRARARAIVCPPVGEEQRNARGALLRIAQRLAERGTLALVFDPLGHGDSTGDVEPIGVARLVRDLAHVAAHPALDGPPDALIGVRLGAAAAIEAIAGRIVPPLRRLVLVAPVLRGLGFDAFATLGNGAAVPIAPTIVLPRSTPEAEADELRRACDAAFIRRVDDPPFWVPSRDTMPDVRGLDAALATVFPARLPEAA